MAHRSHTRASFRSRARGVLPQTFILLIIISLAIAATLAAPNAANASTNLNFAGCSNPEATSFGVIFPNVPLTTGADCSIEFGSDDTTAQLRVSQRDSAGAAMHATSAAPDLDPTFDTDGVAAVGPAGVNSELKSTVLTPAGAIVSTGHAGDDLLVTRTLANGTLDPSFGTSGRAIIDVAAGASDIGMGVALQSDGSIVIAGRSCGSPCRAFIAKLTPGGQLDTSFNRTGIVLVTDHPDSAFEKIAVDRRDRIVAVGCDQRPNGSCDALIARYRNTGALDHDFAAGGWMRDEISSAIGGSPTTAWDAFQGIAIDARGRIYGAGYAADGAGALHGVVVRYSERGVRDSAGYGTSGVAMRANVTLSSTEGQGVTIDDRGRALLVGEGDAAGQKIPFITRFTAAGAPDTTFATTGTIDLPQGANDAYFEEVVIDAAGRPIAAGVLDETRPTQRALVARFTPTGDFDTTFHTAPDGVLAIAARGSTREAADTIAVGADGALILGGGIDDGTNTTAALWSFAPADTIGDYQPGVNDFDNGASGAFGICLRSTDGNVTPRWTNTGNCWEVSDTRWHAVPTTSDLDGTGTTAAVSAAGDTASNANFRFAVRAPDHAMGDYIAPLHFEVVAPGLTAPTNVNPPTITGLMQERRTVTGQTGLFTGSGPFAYTWQWLQCDNAGSGCTNIAGATAATYLIAASDVGSTLRLQVTATNDQGSASATSAASAIITPLDLHLIYTTGFEHGTLSHLGGGVGDELYPTDNDPQFSMPADGLGHSGSRSLRISQPASASSYWSKYPTPAARTTVVRFAFMAEQVPQGAMVVDFMSSSLKLSAGITMGNDGTVGAYLLDGYDSSSATQAGTATIVPWRWYTVDARIDRTTTTTKLDWMIDGVAQPQVTDNQPSETLRRVTFGAGAPGATVRIDDLAVSNTGSDYPIGAGKTVRLNVDSTISSDPAKFSQSINNGSSWSPVNAGDASWQLVTDWPVTTGPSATVIRQDSSGTPSLTYGLEDTTEPVAPNAVTVVGAIRDQGTPSEQNSLSLASTSGSDWVYQNLNAGTNVEYQAKSFGLRPGGGGNWTRQLLNDATLVLGGTATTQAALTDGVIVEADFPAAPTATPITAPSVSGNAREGSTLTANDGTWGGSPAISRQWLRCDSAGLSCLAIAGQTGTTYALTGADIGSTVRLRVVANTSGGNQIAISDATTVVASALPMLTNFTGFEAGMVSPNGGGLADMVYCNGAPGPSWCDVPAMLPTVTDDVARSGDYSLHTSAADKSGVHMLFNGSSSIGVVRVAVMFDKLPPVREPVLEVTSNTDDCRIWYEPSSQKFNARFNGSLSSPSGTYSSQSVEPWHWYTLDLRCDERNVANWTIDWAVDGVLQAPVIQPQPAGSNYLIQNLDLGTSWRGNPAGSDHYYDDVVMSTTSNDFPIGAGQVQALKPEATGTITSPGQMRYTTTGATSCQAGGAGWTNFVAADANTPHGRSEDLADWPPLTGASATSWCQRNTTALPTVTFSKSTGSTPPSALRVILAAAEEAAGANTMQVDYGYAAGGAGWFDAMGGGGTNLNPTTNVDYFSGSENRRGVDGQPFTMADLNSLVVRLRPTTVASGLLSHALLVEYATQAGATATNITPPRIVQPFSVPKVGDELSVDNGVWSGARGAIDRSWRWQRCDAATGLSCAFIAGEHASTYTLTAADLGARVRVIELADNGNGAQVARSTATQTISAALGATQRDLGFETGLSAPVAPQGTPLAVTSDRARSGQFSLEADASGGPSMDSVVQGTFSTLSMRTYVQLEALPAGVGPGGTAIAMTGTGPSGSFNGAAIFVRADGSSYMTLLDAGSPCTAASNGPTLAPDRWYQMELTSNLSSTTWTASWTLAGSPIATISCSGRTSRSISRIDLGSSSPTGTAKLWFDDFGTNTVANQFPAGGARVTRLNVSGMGATSNPGAFSSDAGAIVPDDWRRLTDYQFGDIFDYVGQRNSDASAFLEWTFDDVTTLPALINVMIMAQGHADSLGMNDVIFKTITGTRTADGDATVCAVADTGYAGTTMIPCSVAAPAGGWTLDELNGLRVRMGYSTSVSPTPWIDAIIAQAAIRE